MTANTARLLPDDVDAFIVANNHAWPGEITFVDGGRVSRDSRFAVNTDTTHAVRFAGLRRPLRNVA